jgi:hypothetical protein
MNIVAFRIQLVLFRFKIAGYVVHFEIAEFHIHTML